MAKTALTLLATDYLMEGQGLLRGSELSLLLKQCKPLRDYIVEDTETAKDWELALQSVSPDIDVALGAVETRCTELLPSGAQGVRKFVNILQAATGFSASAMETVSAVTGIPGSFSDMGPNINNITDLVTGGKTGSFPGGAAALSQVGDSVKKLGSMFPTDTPGTIGNPAELLKNLDSKGLLPDNITSQLSSMGVSDISADIGSLDEDTLKTVLSKIKGDDLDRIVKGTGFTGGSLNSLSDVLDPASIMPAGALASLQGGGLADLGMKLETIGGDTDVTKLSDSLKSVKIPELKNLGSSSNPFARLKSNPKGPSMIEKMGSGSTPTGTPGVYELMGTLTGKYINSHLGKIAAVADKIKNSQEPTLAEVTALTPAVDAINSALVTELTNLTNAGIDLGQPGPTGFVGVMMFGDKLHRYGVDKNGSGVGAFLEELALSANTEAGDSIIAALYEGRNLAA